MSDGIVFEDVSKFYGEILGVNRVNLSIPPGITSLVGPNGSGKTTLMNLMTGLVKPTRGRVQVLGYRTDDPEHLFKILGYSTQFDAFPKGLTGFQFIYSYLRLAGRDSHSSEQLAWRVIERVNLVEAAKRNIAGYSKGMRQRIRLAQALAHDPKVLVLDEPLNGLDPLARSEMIALFRATAAQGCYVIDHITTLRRRGAEQRNHFRSGQRIQAVQRFIEHQYFRIVSQRLRQPNSLAHPLAIPRNVSLGSLDQVHPLNHSPRQLFRAMGVPARQPQIRIDKLKSRQAFRKRVELRAVAQNFKQVLRIIGSIAEHLHSAARGLHQAGHQVHQRSFAGTIRAHQTCDPGRNREVHPVHAQNFAVELRNVFKDDAIAHRITS